MQQPQKQGQNQQQQTKVQGNKGSSGEKKRGEDLVVDNVGKESNKAKSEARKSCEVGKGREASKFGEFLDVICYNCGRLGLHKANCKNQWFVSFARVRIMWWKLVR
jgi:hypothetical protein